MLELLNEISLLDVNGEIARRKYIDFAAYNNPLLQFTWFHRSFYNKIDDFIKGKIKKLMIFIPPQHGKSEGSTRQLVPYALGLDPNKKIAIVSHSANKARKFNREIQRNIDNEKYAKLFPDTKLNDNSSIFVNHSWMRNVDECEIVNRMGGFKTVGVGGQLTGDPVDLLILDDIYKDAISAWSSVIREGIQDWYDTVAETRLHNDSQILIVFTRWHHLDLGGYLLKQEPNEWVVIKYPAIKKGKPTEDDPREAGEALWPEKHSLEKLIKTRNRNPHIFASLYDQDPKPKEGLLYTKFLTYDQINFEINNVKSYGDIADEGDDYLCHIIYTEHNNMIYILDIIYTQDPTEITEDLVAERLAKFNVNNAKFESQSGGKAFAKNVERITREKYKNFTTTVSWFHQTKNKDARILTNSSTVQNVVSYPDNWNVRWPDYYDSMTGYMAKGKNSHDDAQDTITGVVENTKFIRIPKIVW